MIRINSGSLIARSDPGGTDVSAFSGACDPAGVPDLSPKTTLAVARVEAGFLLRRIQQAAEASVSLDLMMRSLLSIGATPRDIAKRIRKAEAA